MIFIFLIFFIEKEKHEIANEIKYELFFIESKAKKNTDFSKKKPLTEQRLKSLEFLYKKTFL